MAITVKHSKVSLIPDAGDASLVEPSDWNADHVLTGTVPVENGGTGATTANGALNALLPTQTGNNGKVLSTDGTNATWTTNGSGDVTGPSSATDNAVARFDTTTGKLIQNSVVTIDDTGVIAGATSISNINYVDFDTAYATTLTEGQLGWDGNNTLGLGMAGGNVTQHIGEDQFFYCKASSAITKGQVVMFTGAVGASGVPKGAPATGVTDGTYIMGVAAESIALNGFGLVQSFGTLRNVNTTGYADGDILWYDPSVTGGLTKTKPSAPNVKVQVAAVINGGSSGGGTILIRINPGSTLGGTDSNAEITSVSNGQILTYDGTNAYWKNTDIASGTGISVSKSATGVLTITNTSPSSGGTVTSVSGIAPIASTGGTTPTISISQASSTTNGYLSSTDWNTFNNKGSGTVTSITAGTGLTGGTITGSGTIAIDSTVATLSGTQTLTNKRVTPRVLALSANSATPAINSDNYDFVNITSQSTAITSFTTNLTGTPTDGQKLWIAITGTTAIALTWGSSFESSTATLPTTTVSTNRLDVGFVWNTATSKWRCVAVA